MDFKEILKDKHKYDNVYIIIDRLNKAIQTAKYYKTAIITNAAILYYEGSYYYYGLPWFIISDKGPQFIADFINKLAKIF